ncbi:MAG TPA: hypothetical protein VHP34_06310 [Alphaproteobacteria bacterium]|nr:hypothetical protein [Alphaproteobacteria bacterium]
MQEIPKKEAFLAMFAFLERRYETSQSDELGSLLGSMMLLTDGETADPAIWEDWCEAIRKVEAGEVSAHMELE